MREKVAWHPWTFHTLSVSHIHYTRKQCYRSCLSFDGITIIIAVVVVMMLIVYLYSFLTCSNMLIDVSSCNTKSHTSVFCLLFCISVFLLIWVLWSTKEDFLKCRHINPQNTWKNKEWHANWGSLLHYQLVRSKPNMLVISCLYFFMVVWNPAALLTDSGSVLLYVWITVQSVSCLLDVRRI